MKHDIEFALITKLLTKLIKTYLSQLPGLLTGNCKGVHNIKTILNYL